MTVRALAGTLPLAVLIAMLTFAAGSRADGVRRSFTAVGLAFELAPETWSKSVRDLAALLERVRPPGADRRPVVTLADVMQLNEGRREVIRELELVAP